MSHASARVLRFHALNRNTLKGLADIALTSGLVLHGCAYHAAENGRRWVGLPGAPQVSSGQLVRDKKGKVQYRPTVGTVDRSAGDRLQAVLLAAVDAHLSEVAS